MRNIGTFSHLILITFFSAFLPSRSFAETRECVLKQESSISDEKTGASLGTLKRGDRVYSRWGEESPPWMYIVKNGNFQPVEGIQYSMLDCDTPRADAEYPIVFKGLVGRVQLYKEFGIEADPVAYNSARDQLPPMPHKCFYIGDGFMGMELSEATFAAYKEKGFSLENVCMVLRSGQVRFDPETGARLPTYVIVDGSGKEASITDELLFQAPSCFARGTLSKGQFSATLNPIGCKVNYHPWSGRKLDPSEVAFFTSKTLLIGAGDAGDVKEDSANLANDPNKQATAARIQAIKQSSK
jgi:hypothetical protein